MTYLQIKAKKTTYTYIWLLILIPFDMYVVMCYLEYVNLFYMSILLNI